MCRRWLALGREDALWRALAAARPDFSWAFSGPSALVPRGWQAWYSQRAAGAARWRSAAPRGVTVLEGHLGTVFGVCAHPQAPRALFSAGEDARLRLWDAATGALAAAVDVPSLQGLFNVHAFAAPGGACFAAACGFNGDVCLLPLHAPSSAGGARLAARLTAADLRARFAAVGLDADDADAAGGANLAAALEALRAAEGARERCAAALPRAAGRDAGTEAPPLAGVATPQGPGVLLAGHAAPVVAARDRDGTLATCSFDGSIRLWSVAAAAAAGDAADAAAREAAQKAEASGSRLPQQRQPPVFASSMATLSDVPPDAPLGPHEYSVAAICLPAGAPTTLVRGGNDGLVKIWDLEARTVTSALAGHGGWIWCLEAGDEAGNLMLSGATDSAIRGWDLRAPRGGNALRAETLPNAGPVSGLAVRPAEGRVASGSFDGQVRLFDLRMWGAPRAAQCPGGAPRAQMGPGLRGHTDRVSRVAATASYVASAGFDTTVRVMAFDDIL